MVVVLHKADHLPIQLYLRDLFCLSGDTNLALRYVLTALQFRKQVFGKNTLKTSSWVVRTFFLMWELFRMALIQNLICYECLASSNLTQAFPKLPRQPKLLFTEGNTYFLLTIWSKRVRMTLILPWSSPPYRRARIFQCALSMPTRPKSSLHSAQIAEGKMYN